jgi:hypothetical protein
VLLGESGRQNVRVKRFREMQVETGVAQRFPVSRHPETGHRDEKNGR